MTAANGVHGTHVEGSLRCLLAPGYSFSRELSTYADAPLLKL